MIIQILGPGCPKCSTLTANVEQALRDTGISAQIEKVSSLTEMVKFRVMTTPVLVVDGLVKSEGKVLSPAEIAEILGA